MVTVHVLLRTAATATVAIALAIPLAACPNQPQKTPEPAPAPGKGSDPAPAPTPKPEEQPIPDPQPLTDADGVAFTYDPPGVLVAGSGDGVQEDTLWAPEMRFPVGDMAAYANSQYFGVGGHGYVPKNLSWKAKANYSSPWRDVFCEKRDAPRANPYCAGQNGHQGQDIRGDTWVDKAHPIVAPEDGDIVLIQSHTVQMLGASGRKYNLLHMNPIEVKALHPPSKLHVTRGEVIGHMSNYFGSTQTTQHLHFDLKAPVKNPDNSTGWKFVPPYASLVDAYERQLAGTP